MTRLLDTEKELGFAILQFLSGKIQQSSEGSAETFEVAQQCLSDAFGLDLNNTADASRYSLGGHNLLEVFEAGKNSLGISSATPNPDASSAKDVASKNPVRWRKWVSTLETKGYFAGCEVGSKEYQDRYQKAMAKFAEKLDSSTPASAAQSKPAPSPAELEAAAEKAKSEGNAALSAQEYEKAIELYNKAIELSPNGPNTHIYYCNRAAAQSHLSDYSDAITSCEKSIEINNKYAKAYSRMGYAHFQLGDYENAVDSYRRSLELDPNNANSREFLAKAEEQLQGRNQQQQSRSAPASGGGQPDLGSLLGGLGGAGGLAGLMNNPMMMQMAQQMMQDPQMMAMAQNMMQNPSALGQMMSGLGGGGSGGNQFGQSDPEASRTGSSAGTGGAAGLSSLLNPQNLARLQTDPRLQHIRDDPKVRQMFEEASSQGPMAAMRHLSDPDVMQKLKEAMQILGT